MDWRLLVKVLTTSFGIFLDVLSFYVLDDFFRFLKNSGFGVFLVYLTVVSVLLSASAERCFVSRMRDFLKRDLYKNLFRKFTFKKNLLYIRERFVVIV